MYARALAVAIFALAAATATAAEAAPKLIYKVDKVTAAIIRGRLVVSASGAVNSGGWSLPRLHHKEVRTPESDTETFEFLATPPPTGTVVIQALLPIQMTAVFPLPRYATLQVKVVSESNAVVAPIVTAPPAPAAPLAKPYP
ncbi:MAG: hypothetical protein WDM91_04595 [Rhizomicrobium sp.]